MKKYTAGAIKPLLIKAPPVKAPPVGFVNRRSPTGGVPIAGALTCGGALKGKALTAAAAAANLQFSAAAAQYTCTCM